MSELTVLNLAKPALDIGLYTNQLDQTLAFWQSDAGVTFDHLLKVGSGLHQHRHQIGNSVLKINHPRSFSKMTSSSSKSTEFIFSLVSKSTSKGKTQTLLKRLWPQFLVKKPNIFR